MTPDRLTDSLDKAFDDHLSSLFNNFCIAFGTIGPEQATAHFTKGLANAMNAYASTRQLFDSLPDVKKN